MADTDYEEYKDFDMTNATRGIHPAIKALQTKNTQMPNTATKKTTSLDEDVLEWLAKQDDNTKNRINTVIRQFMALS